MVIPIHLRVGHAGNCISSIGMLELPIRMVQSVGDAVLLTVPLDELRQVLPSAANPV